MQLLIIGTGSIGERHLRNFLRIEGTTCSIAEVSEETRERVASQYPVKAAYTDYRDADLSDFDGVVICVPANLHVPIARDVVLSGTHVLTEKPLAMSLEGVSELKQLRDEKGVVASVAFTYRSDPVIGDLRDRIRARSMGAARFITYQAGQNWPMMRKDYPPRYAQSRDTGGGAIPDHLVHVINYLEWIFGPPVEVSARQWKLALPEIGTEDAGHVALHFPGDVVAHLSICLFQRDTTLALQVVAEEGTMRVSLGSEALELFDGTSGEWRSGHIRALDRDDVFLNQGRHFISCIRGEDTPRCTLEEAEQTLRTVLAALESSDSSGGFVDVTNP